MKFLTATIALVLNISALARAQDRHILEDGVVSGAEVLWAILGVPKEGNWVEGIPSTSELARITIEQLKEQGEFPDEVTKKLRANKPIRTSEQINSFIGKLPIDDDEKGALRKWFSEQKRTAIDKEAMFYLLHFIAPKPN